MGPRVRTVSLRRVQPSAEPQRRCGFPYITTAMKTRPASMLLLVVAAASITACMGAPTAQDAVVPETQLLAEHSTASQESAEPALTDGSYYLQNRDHTGRCVHPSGGHALHNGVKLVWHDGGDGTRLQFRMLDAGDGYYYLQNRDTGRCVHPGGGHANRNGVELVWHDGCDGTRLQFKLVGVPSLSASEEDASDDVLAHMTDQLKAVGEETTTEVAKEDKAEAEVDKKLLSETTHLDPAPVSESHPEATTLQQTHKESPEVGLKS